MKMSSEFFSNVSTAFCSDLKYPKSTWFYQKNEWASMKMLYFVNWRNAAQLNSANIFLSKSIFYVKNQPTFSISFFHWKISILTIFCSKKKSNFNFKTYLLLGPILDRAKLCQFTKYIQHFSWSPFNLFDKIKLILDTTGLNKKLSWYLSFFRAADKVYVMRE